VATVSRPGFPDREAALHRRTTEGLIAEELRRLDPDDIYGDTLAAIDLSPAARETTSPRKPATPTSRATKPSTRAAPAQPRKKPAAPAARSRKAAR
jgi:hypothetical protein